MSNSLTSYTVNESLFVFRARHLLTSGCYHSPSAALQTLLQQSGGISLAYSPNGMDTDADTARRLYRELQAFICAHGPFDGLMGFSEGATVAASLMAEDRRRGFAGFKCAILFCATDMCCMADLELDIPKITHFGSETDFVVVDVPTAHIWSNSDAFVDSAMPKRVASLCNKNTREVYIHDLGHDVPGSLSERHVNEVVRIIERVIEKAKDF